MVSLGDGTAVFEKGLCGDCGHFSLREKEKMGVRGVMDLALEASHTS